MRPKKHRVNGKINVAEASHVKKAAERTKRESAADEADAPVLELNEPMLEERTVHVSGARDASIPPPPAITSPMPSRFTSRCAFVVAPAGAPRAGSRKRAAEVERVEVGAEPVISEMSEPTRVLAAAPRPEPGVVTRPNSSDPHGAIVAPTSSSSPQVSIRCDLGELGFVEASTSDEPWNLIGLMVDLPNSYWPGYSSGMSQCTIVGVVDPFISRHRLEHWLAPLSHRGPRRPRATQASWRQVGRRAPAILCDDEHGRHHVQALAANDRARSQRTRSRPIHAAHGRRLAPCAQSLTRCGCRAMGAQVHRQACPGRSSMLWAASAARPTPDATLARAHAMPRRPSAVLSDATGVRRGGVASGHWHCGSGTGRSGVDRACVLPSVL